MICTNPGHTYSLDAFEESQRPRDEPRQHSQNLQFVHKEEKNGEFVLVRDGTTNEEVLSMLIDRMYYLQSKAACRENSIVITKLEECLMWLEKRTNDRINRNVEGTPVA